MFSRSILCRYLESASASHHYLEGKPCEVYEAPFDVLLPAGDEQEDETDTVVQPDIVVYCDKSKLCESRGVREYWVVDPTELFADLD